MRLQWTRVALDEFEHAHDYIAQENPQAARAVAERLSRATKLLVDYPRIGRVGEDEDTREWPVDKTPYLLVYRIRGDAIELLRVWHTSRGDRNLD
ncbi:MAG TPA: type II toxin-antitoxin system RelE/ParE family toxin [Gammaproteobacteria bacterium]|nr:type II toxin-antitoxin system RelE/ParE family toxin [Gammaproteobacteria bacterium]